MGSGAPSSAGSFCWSIVFTHIAAGRTETFALIVRESTPPRDGQVRRRLAHPGLRPRAARWRDPAGGTWRSDDSPARRFAAGRRRAFQMPFDSSSFSRSSGGPGHPARAPVDRLDLCLSIVVIVALIGFYASWLIDVARVGIEGACGSVHARIPLACAHAHLSFSYRDDVGLADACSCGPLRRRPALPHRAGESFSGLVRYVGDGDSLCVGRTDDPGTWIEVRLADFNAPELAASEGRAAITALERIAMGRMAQCTAGGGRSRRVVSYDRVIATCRIAGRRIGDLMREAGIEEGGR